MVEGDEMLELLDDTGLETTLERRRLLVVGVLVGLTGYVAGGLAGLPVVSCLAMAVMAGAWWLLRRAIGDAADRADSGLRERRLSQRDQANLTAYRLLGGVVAVLVIASLGWELFDVEQVSAAVAQVMVGGLLFLLIALPTCIVGWADQEV